MSKSRTTYIIGGVVVALLLVLTLMMIVSPRLAEAREIGERATEQEVANELLEAKVVGLNKTLARSDEIVAQGRGHAERFPPTAELANLFLDVNNAARRAGIPQNAIVTLAPASPSLIGSDGEDGGSGLPSTAKNASLAKMQLTLQVNSNYPQLVRFLKQLEDMERVYLLNGVTVATEDEERGLYSTNLVGDMFLMRQDELDVLLEQVQLLNGSTEPTPATVPAPAVSGVPVPSGSPVPAPSGSVVPSPQSTTLQNLPGVPDVEITTAPPARETPNPASS